MNYIPSISNISPRFRRLAGGAALALLACATSCGPQKKTVEDVAKPNTMTSAAAELAMEALDGMGVTSGKRIIVWSALPAGSESLLNAFREEAQSRKLEIVRVDVSSAAAERGGAEYAQMAGDGGLADWLGRVEPVDAIVLFSPPDSLPKVPGALRTKRSKTLIVGFEFNEMPGLMKAGLADAAVISRPGAIAPEKKATREQLKGLLQIVTKP